MIAILAQLVRVAAAVSTASMAGRYALTYRGYRRVGSGVRASTLMVTAGILLCVATATSINFAANSAWTPGSWVLLVEIALMGYGHVTAPTAQELARKERA